VEPTLADSDHVVVEGASYVFKIIRDVHQHDEKKVSLKMGKKKFKSDRKYVRTVEELTELAQTTFETNAPLSLQLIEAGRPAVLLDYEHLVVSNLKEGSKI